MGMRDNENWIISVPDHCAYWFGTETSFIPVDREGFSFCLKVLSPPRSNQVNDRPNKS
jgi:hypothetical protein